MDVDVVQTTDPLQALRGRLIAFADRFQPRGLTDVEQVARIRAGVLLSVTGALFASAMGLVLVGLGAPVTGASFIGIGVACATAPPLVRRGASFVVIAHTVTGATWLASFAVALRTGGLLSPAMVWSFLHPLNIYAVAGRRHAVWWAALGAVQFLTFFALTVSGFTFAMELREEAIAVLRVSAFVTMIGASLIVLVVVDGVRRDLEGRIVHAQRVIDRERIFADVHDGLGGQLLNLLARARADRLDTRGVVHGLEDALDDLRLIVHAMDPNVPSLELALAELRWRLEPRCTAAGVELTWPANVPVNLSPRRNLDVLRAVQEMITNALRHSGSARITLTTHLADDGLLSVAVRDEGRGFTPDAERPTGRGLRNLHVRAVRLGGVLSVTPADPGACVTLTVPLRAGRAAKESA